MSDNSALHGGARLPKRTLDYLAHQTEKGRRNDELFAAAAQYRDAGLRLETAKNELLPRAVDRDGLSKAEATKTIESAFDGVRREPIPEPANKQQSPNPADQYRQNTGTTGTGPKAQNQTANPNGACKAIAERPPGSLTYSLRFRGSL